MRRIALLVLFAVIGVGAAACGGGDGPDAGGDDATVREVGVMMRDVVFEPAVIEVERGERVRLNFENSGALLHDFSIDSMPMGRMEVTGSVTGNRHGGHGPETAMHMALVAGKRGMIEFEATEAGEYVYYCTEPGHRDAGMHGILRVN